MNWQPIETAPRDGTAIFAFWAPASGKVHAGCFGVTEFDTVRSWVNPEDSDDEYCEPTHWMPLPPVPDAQPAQEPNDDLTIAYMVGYYKGKKDANHTALLEQALEALEEMRQEYVSTVDGEWGEGVGVTWLPKTSDPAIAAIKEALPK